MQNRWTTVRTPSDFMKFQWISDFFWFSGSKVSLTLGLEHRFGKFPILTTLFYFCIWSDYFPSRWSPEINFSALFAQNPRNACIYALKACSELIFQQRLWKVIEFPSFDTVKTTPFAYRFLRNFLPNLSSGQWFYCLSVTWKYFASS